MSRRPALSLTAIAVAGAIAGCGGSSREGVNPREVVRVRAIAVEPQRDRIRLELPETIPAGPVRIQIRNGTVHPTNAQFMRVRGSRGADDVAQALDAWMAGGDLEPWITPAGGVGVTRAYSFSAVEQVLEPGTYFVVDDRAEGGRGLRGYRRGAIARVRVTGEARTAPIPPYRGTIDLFEYGFRAERLTGDAVAGRASVRVRNRGTEPHEVVVAPLARGRTVADVRRFLRNGARSTGRPPVDLRGAFGTAILAPGEQQIVHPPVRPGGRYVLLCFARDRSGGAGHATGRGQIEEVRVL